MAEDTFEVMVGDAAQSVSLADIAGVDMSQIEAYRGGEPTPQGIYEFKLTETNLDTMEVFDKEKEDTVDRPVIMLSSEIIAVRQLKDKGIDPQSLIGLTHIERIFIRDIEKDLGRVTAFLQDIGMTGQGTLQDLLDQAVGTEYVAGISHRKDKNDTSRVFANLDFRTVEPLAGATVPTAAPAQQSAGGGIKI